MLFIGVALHFNHRINPKTHLDHQNSSRASKMGSGPPQADQVDLYRGESTLQSTQGGQVDLGVDTTVDTGSLPKSLLKSYFGHILVIRIENSDSISRIFPRGMQW